MTARVHRDPWRAPVARRDLVKWGAAGLALGSRIERAAAQASPAASLEPEGDVTIEYWQYEFAGKVDLVNELIPEFQEANPKITVEHVNFPYDNFQAQVATAVQAGEGPDVLNVYYGWVPAYVQQQFFVPLPADAFPADQLASQFFPMVESVKFGDDYFALPTAVRTLALFYNIDMFTEAGIEPPTTWEETVAAAEATTKRSGDTLEVAGITYDPAGQGHHWWRECLTRQNGLVPMSEDKRTLNWSDPLGVEAFQWYMSFIKDMNVTENAFYTDGQTAFGTGHAALHVDGSFRLSTYANDQPNLNFGVVALPANKEKATFASFWCNGITRNAAEGDKLIAAAKFIDFLASPDVMRRWTPAIGELPARPEIANEEQFTQDPKLAAFIEQLPNAYATFFVNEAENRQAVLDAMDQVLLEDMDAAVAVEEAQARVQQILDDYWANAE